MKQDLSGHLGQIFGELKDTSAADAKKDEEAGIAKQPRHLNEMSQTIRLKVDWRAGTLALSCAPRQRKVAASCAGDLSGGFPTR